MRFDPQSRRRNLKTEVLDYLYNLSYEKIFHERTLGSSGCITLNIATQCYLVGLLSDGSTLLQKAHTFLRSAHEQNEEHGAFGIGAILAHLAIAHWFLERRTDLKSLVLCVDWKEERFAAERTKPDKGEVQLALTPYLEAERYETLIARYESAGLKPPKNIRRILGEGTMCYVLARHRLGLEYTDEEITAALETFLKRSVKEWLGRYGRFITAARWMKIAHWKPGDDPVATLLRCYDYLPGLKPPKYTPDSPGTGNAKNSAIGD